MVNLAAVVILLVEGSEPLSFSFVGIIEGLLRSPLDGGFFSPVLVESVEVDLLVGVLLESGLE